MARYATTVVSQTAQLAGVNATTTVNGYIGYTGASATAGFRMRRITVGVRTTTASVPTSQQITVGLYRQTVAPAGTGLAAAQLGGALETHTLQTDPTVGTIVTTATTIGTTGPTLTTATPLHSVTFNSQSTVDFPLEFLEELVVGIGTANGLAYVNIGNTLPAGHLIVLSLEYEV
jgi:hypothetical protein